MNDPICVLYDSLPISIFAKNHGDLFRVLCVNCGVRFGMHSERHPHIYHFSRCNGFKSISFASMIEGLCGDEVSD